MKIVNVNFEAVPLLKCIEVLFRASEKDTQVEELMERVNKYEPERLAFVEEDNGVRIIETKNIISVSVSKKYVTIITENERYFAKQSLQSIEEHLDKSKFVRISRHEIISLAKVSKYNFDVAGTLSIEMTNGMETWAARRAIPQIRKILLGKE